MPKDLKAIVVMALTHVQKVALLDTFNELKTAVTFFSAGAQALQIHRDLQLDRYYNLVIADNVATVQGLRALNPDVHIVGVIKAASSEAEQKTAAFVEAGADECVGEFIDKETLERIIGSIKKSTFN